MRSEHGCMIKLQEAALIDGSRRPAKVKMRAYFEVSALSRAAAKGPVGLSCPYAGEKVDLLKLKETLQLTGWCVEPVSPCARF